MTIQTEDKISLLANKCVQLNYELIRNRIETITSRIEVLGGEVQEVIIDEPATPDQIIQTEEQLGVKLPESFKRILIEFSGNFSLRWFLPYNMEQPNEFIDIFYGNTTLEFKTTSSI